MPEFYMIFAPKMAEFLQIIGQIIFSRFFFWGGGTCLPLPPSPTPMGKVPV